MTAAKPEPFTYGDGSKSGTKVHTPSFMILASHVKTFFHEHINTTPSNQAEKVFSEALELVDEPDNLDEAADVVIATLGWVYASGLTAEDLLTAIAHKMRKNRNRTWATDPVTGEVRHTNEEES